MSRVNRRRVGLTMRRAVARFRWTARRVRRGLAAFRRRLAQLPGMTVAVLRRLRRPALLLGVGLVASSILGAAAYATTTFYGQFGAPRTAVSELTWAARAPTYLTGDCRGCHADAAAQAAPSEHDRLICETCHVPSADHPGPVAGVVQMLPPANAEQCRECHRALVGRPAGFAQVALDRHYAGADCLACHEPHSAAAVAPRVVTHPLANLPECTTCHTPDGLKQFPANHQAAPDEVCLACHREGARGDD